MLVRPNSVAARAKGARITASSEASIPSHFDGDATHIPPLRRHHCHDHRNQSIGMSGFEVVGVVFAVLPLFAEAGKLYAQGPMHKAFSPAQRDEKLASFYMYFWWEVFELQNHLQTLIDKLPHLSEETKCRMVSTRDADSWDKDSEIAQALADFFPERECQAFRTIMDKVLKLLSHLVKDDSLHISTSERVTTS